MSKISTIINLLYSVYGPKTCICIRFCLPFFVFIWANIIKYNETDVKDIRIFDRKSLVLFNK